MERLTPHRLVGGEIRGCYDSAMVLNEIRQLARQFAPIEVVCRLVAESLQRSRKVLLVYEISRSGSDALRFQENSRKTWIEFQLVREPLDFMSQMRAQREPIARQPDCRRRDLLELHRAVALERGIDAGDFAGRRHGQGAVPGEIFIRFAVTHIHGSAGFEWR